ncbi:MFS transporter [Actinoplanes sp. M2I2]|uniref:MFS transporter n=1 Tax=Actinoplanes sp. M2I2 TaxID=1734444 RepID=UPI002021899B|nr:MFS transporter [Actinoplanes sp. M2I2]
MRFVPVAYLGSYVLSLLGNSIAAIALPLVVLQTTGSTLGAGAVAAATAVPALLAGLLMGVVIDRVNRRSSSVATDLISAASVAALPLLDLFTDLNVGLFVLFGVIGSLGDIPGLTAREALLPAVVRESGLSAERLIGLRETISAAVIVIGPAIAGVLIGVLEGAGVLWVTAGTSFAAALVTLLIPRRVGAVAAPAGPARPRVVARQLREGWSTLLGSPILLLLTTISLVAGLVLAAFQGLILPVHFTATGQASLLGLVLSAIAVGLLIGSAIYTVFAKRGSHRAAWLHTGLIGTGAGFAVIATLHSTPVILIGGVLVGLGSGLVGGLIGVLSLERIPDGLRGRVLGTQNALLTVAPALGIMGAAVLIEAWSVTVAAVVATAVWAALALGALVTARPSALGSVS